MHIHAAIVGDVRLYILVTDLVGGPLQAGVAITPEGETLWRLDEMMLPSSVRGADDDFRYAIAVGHEIAEPLQSRAVGPLQRYAMPART